MHDMWAQRQMADDVIFYIIIPVLIILVSYIAHRLLKYQPPADTEPKRRVTVTKHVKFPPLESDEE